MLVGTHATGVPNAADVVGALFAKMEKKYPAQLEAGVAVDSLNGVNVKTLLNYLIEIAKQEVLYSPSDFFI